jgi:hypothetical protein
VRQCLVEESEVTSGLTNLAPAYHFDITDCEQKSQSENVFFTFAILIFFGTTKHSLVIFSYKLYC